MVTHRTWSHLLCGQHSIICEGAFINKSIRYIFLLAIGYVVNFVRLMAIYPAWSVVRRKTRKLFDKIALLLSEQKAPYFLGFGCQGHGRGRKRPIMVMSLLSNFLHEN